MRVGCQMAVKCRGGGRQYECVLTWLWEGPKDLVKSCWEEKKIPLVCGQWYFWHRGAEHGNAIGWPIGILLVIRCPKISNRGTRDGEIKWQNALVRLRQTTD